MGELIPYEEQFGQVIDIIESAKERARTDFDVS